MKDSIELRNKKQEKFMRIKIPFFKTENELERLRFQSSDDINDCVKYIAAINDKMNQIEMLHENQHSITEYVQYCFFSHATEHAMLKKSFLFMLHSNVMFSHI